MRMVNVMIADDNIAFTQYLSSILTKEKDFSIVNISYDGLSAIENYTKLKPDVLLLDLAMPGCTGIEVLDSINIHTKYNNVIILSDSEELHSKIYDTSKFDWKFSKTVSQSKLFEIIRMIKSNNTASEIDDDLNFLFDKFLFDFTDNTELVKEAIIKAYENPNLQLEEIVKKMIDTNPKILKNYKSVYQSINRCVNNAIKRHDDLSEFDGILPSVFKYNPKPKIFINGMAKYLRRKYK